MHDKFFKIARTNMVKNQILTINVKNKKLVSAIMKIEKEKFVPELFQDIVYSDSDISIMGNKSMIRTFILAKMIDFCNFTKDDSILVIGCLNGYSVAILSNLVNYVFGLENDNELVLEANDLLSSMNFHNCSVFFSKNLTYGLKKNAPYDKIFIEGSVNYVPEQIVEQLKDNGKIFTVLNRSDDNFGEFVCGVKIDSKISFSNLFHANIKLLKDFIIEENDYETNI